MELRVNTETKKKITSLVIDNTKMLKNLLIAGKIVLIVGLVLSVIYAVVYIFSPTLSIVNVRGIATKDYASIITNTILFAVLSVFVSMILKALLSNLSSKDINERADETLIITETGIRYVFRTRYHSAPTTRIIVSIPFNQLQGVMYDAHIRKIVFTGRISSNVVEDYNQKKHIEPTSGNLKELNIYDYFEPGLLNQLKKMGVQV